MQTDAKIKTVPFIFCYVLFFVAVYLVGGALVEGGKSPMGADVVGSIGKTNQCTEFYESTGVLPLWNPYIFSGTPIYYRGGWDEDPIVWPLRFLICFGLIKLAIRKKSDIVFAFCLALMFNELSCLVFKFYTSF